MASFKTIEQRFRSNRYHLQEKSIDYLFKHLPERKQVDFIRRFMLQHNDAPEGSRRKLFEDFLLEAVQQLRGSFTDEYKTSLVRNIVKDQLAFIRPEGPPNAQTREAWLLKTLQEIPAGKRILDAGAGELQYKSYCEHLDYVSQDFGQYDGKGDNEGLQTGSWDQSRLDIVSDITAIPEPDASFDAIMCIEVLEHLPYPVDALKELTRLLKKDGFLILTAPFCALTHFSPYFYQTGYSHYFYRYWLEQLGYDIIEIMHNGNFFDYLDQEIRRIESTAQTYCQEALTDMDRMVIALLVNRLGQFAQRDQGSQEILSFGLHVLARKK